MTRGGISRSLAAVLVVVLLIIITAGIVLVWSPFGGSPSPSSTSTVSTPANLLAATGQLPSSYCSQPSSPYSNSSLMIDWGNLAPNTEGIQFVCLKNTGTTAITLTVGSNLSPSIGTVSSPQAGTVLNGLGITMIEIDLRLSSSVQPGPIPSFTITVGGAT